MGAKRFFKKVNLVLLIFQLVLLLASTFGNKWLENYTDHVGLWEICRQMRCSWMDYTPTYLEPFLDWWSCVRAFMILSVIFTFFAIIFQIVNLRNENKIRSFHVRHFEVFNVFFLVVAVVVFATKKGDHYDEGWVLSWSYVIACFCFCLSAAMVPLICCLAKDESKERHFPAINVSPPMPTIPVQQIPVSARYSVPTSNISVQGQDKPDDVLIDMSTADKGDGSGRASASVADKKSLKSVSTSASQRRHHSKSTDRGTARSASKSSAGRSASKSSMNRSASKSSIGKTSYTSTEKSDYSSSEGSKSGSGSEDSYSSDGSSYSGSSGSSRSRSESENEFL